MERYTITEFYGTDNPSEHANEISIEISSPERMAEIINSYTPYFNSFIQRSLLAYVAKRQDVSPWFYNKLQSLVDVSRNAEAPVKKEVEDVEDMYA